ncbi:MAG: tetratricopeptide repeat protein [Proteobacteria bacterium]|nr:tetratricopeptide repeat protein [Pseudomonadota bacterium]
MRWRWAALVVLALAACTRPDPLARARADCANEALPPSAQANACSALIDSSDLPAAERADALALSGVAHARAGDTRTALQEFASALAVDDGNARALEGRAHILIRSGQFDAAEPLVERLVASGAAGARAHLMAGEIAAGRGDYNAAIEAFSAALQREPRNAVALAGRARMKEAQGDHDGARADFDAAIAIDPNLAAARAGRCWLAIQQSRDPAGDGPAREDADAAVAAAPRDFDAQTCLGILALRARQWPDAKQAFDVALAVRPGDPMALFGRGVARRRSGDGPGITDMDQARDFDHHIGERFDQLGVATY